MTDPIEIHGRIFTVANCVDEVSVGVDLAAHVGSLYVRIPKEEARMWEGQLGRNVCVRIERRGSHVSRTSLLKVAR